jgi:hypothetical protein
MHTAPFRLVPVTMGTHTYWMVVDSRGYPVAQGTEATCRKALEDRS